MTTILLIKRTEAERFSVTTDVRLSDGSFQADHFMKLAGNVLRSHEQRGLIRVGGLMKLTLGPVSLAKVQALNVGEEVTIAG